MKPAKYPNGIRTKREYLQRIRHAEANALFFSRDTMRFFGRQRFNIDDDGNLVVTFPEKRPGYAAVYKVDPTIYKLTPEVRHS